eukprot:scpid80345/ scgid28714/ Serine/threonine-protein kinase STK11; Liver kinase B1 homolog
MKSDMAGRDGLVEVGSFGQGADEVDWDNDFIHPVDTTTQVIVEQYQKTASCIAGRYLKGVVLGEGSYGKVKEMLDVLSLHRRAVKILNRRRLRKKIPGGEANVEREIQLLRKLNHEHVVKLIEVLYNEEKLKIYMVMEYCVCPLEEMLRSTRDQKFPIQQGHNYFCQTILGVEYLHSQRVIHKDLKPDNLLLTHQHVVKICDFGVAEQLDLFSNDDSIHSSQGSPVFQPPEVSLGHGAISGFKLDIWGVGVTLYHFVSGDYPFMGENTFQIFKTVAKGEYKMPTGLSDNLQDLIRGMLEYDASKRLSVNEVKHHLWFMSAHALQRNESWLAVPPMQDFEHDELRGMTCIDTLMSLHQNNLPTCPLYLTDEHMAHLMNRGTTAPVFGSSQGAQESVLGAAAASFGMSPPPPPDPDASHLHPRVSIGSRSGHDILNVEGAHDIAAMPEGADNVSRSSDNAASRRQLFHSARDISSNVTQLSARRMSNSSRKTSTRSHSSSGAGQAPRSQLADNAGGGGEAAMTDGSTTTDRLHRLQGRQLSNREVSSGVRATRASLASTASAPATSSHGVARRRYRAPQCRQQ